MKKNTCLFLYFGCMYSTMMLYTSDQVTGDIGQAARVSCVTTPKICREKVITSSVHQLYKKLRKNAYDAARYQCMKDCIERIKNNNPDEWSNILKSFHIDYNSERAISKIAQCFSDKPLSQEDEKFVKKYLHGQFVNCERKLRYKRDAAVANNIIKAYPNIINAIKDKLYTESKKTFPDLVNREFAAIALTQEQKKSLLMYLKKKYEKVLMHLKNN